jgi:hypothetical protein
MILKILGLSPKLSSEGIPTSSLEFPRNTVHHGLFAPLLLLLLLMPEHSQLPQACIRLLEGSQPALKVFGLSGCRGCTGFFLSDASLQLVCSTTETFHLTVESFDAMM